eukprot:TRINITY_DN31443_c0_g1_i1.p2 TRINITY_DN31443_c0_g1~~TRINITY_DN31443_c0_g1_i1.p2  ORF type:complete len:106 (+),score=29.68 TRINITY_DN31443_c0_g1_i1:170-487(+)
MAKEKEKQAGDLDKVTDYHEEREMNTSKVEEAMSILVAEEKKDKEAAAVRERQLAAVKVNAEDIALIVQEMEVDVQTAERKLREHDGDVVVTLQALVNTPASTAP